MPFTLRSKQAQVTRLHHRGAKGENDCPAAATHPACFAFASSSPLEETFLQALRSYLPTVDTNNPSSLSRRPRDYHDAPNLRHMRYLSINFRIILSSLSPRLVESTNEFRALRSHPAHLVSFCLVWSDITEGLRSQARATSLAAVPGEQQQRDHFSAGHHPDCIALKATR